MPLVKGLSNEIMYMSCQNNRSRPTRIPNLICFKDSPTGIPHCYGPSLDCPKILALIALEGGHILPTKIEHLRAQQFARSVGSHQHSYNA
ncbi:hypothetical protein J6590_021495 [Homalodisca vitripennis]|nr:hypothetical protein J6590_021495 [Homalodisca vitripennis]